MLDLDTLNSEIDALMAGQREAWRELASPSLTGFDRREIRNRIRQDELDLREYLNVRTERLRPQPRLVDPTGEGLAAIPFRLF